MTAILPNCQFERSQLVLSGSSYGSVTGTVLSHDSTGLPWSSKSFVKDSSAISSLDYDSESSLFLATTTTGGLHVNNTTMT